MEEINSDNQENYGMDSLGESKSKSKSKWRRFILAGWILALVLILVVLGGALVWKTSFTYSQMKIEEAKGLLPLSESTPQPDADRLNILILGLRGEEDSNGGLLTDSIMVLSLKKSTGQVALISIPRDFYMKMPGENYKEKINFAYALGFEKKGAAGALLYSKTVVSQVTGLYINYAVSVNHEAFREIVNILGGIDIILDKPFREDQQFSKEMIIDLPAGSNHLNGTTTLYFVRSRFTTSDFDRARRQQEVLLAIKDKAFSLGVISNPVKIFQILSSLGKNVRLDLPLSEIKNWLFLADSLKDQKVIHKVFDTTPEGLLYASKSESDTYILLPVGDNFKKIQEACRKIFD